MCEFDAAFKLGGGTAHTAGTFHGVLKLWSETNRGCEYSSVN